MKDKFKGFCLALNIAVFVALAALIVTAESRLDDLEARVAAIETCQQSVAGNMITVMDVMKRVANTVTR